ncbi:MAG: AMP-binding protein, partial [bacterium]|nr:AMP-binding protein [bacterium]
HRGKPAELASVRQLLAGGDVLSAPHRRRVLAQLPQTTLINGYGPTENTTFTCCAPIDRVAEVDDSVSIGRPISGTRVHVLDRELRPVPTGVFGELLIAGDGLARGYFDRPALTAEHFIPSPLGPHPGARLYRTGDVVRPLFDGRIEFLGRRDFQVKVRGFRIELGEVEAVLGAHPQVQESVVVVRDDGVAKLTAFVVARVEPAPAAAELRRHLLATLPDYMVPAVFVPLDSLPLTPNGKVDRAALARRALPAAEWAAGEKAGYVAPRTPVEETLVEIWAELLGVREVGVHDDFFELGGHSLLATQLVSRVRDVFRVELPLRAVFESPRVAGMAEALPVAGSQDLGPALVRVPRERDLPTSFAQRRLWFIDRLVPDSPFYNIYSAFRLQGPLDVTALRRTFTEIVRRHESLRTTFRSAAAEPRQVIAPPFPAALPLVDLRALPELRREDELERLSEAESRRPFDLARGPLLRVTLVRIEGRSAGREEHVLFLNVHHIISDGWSTGVFFRELPILYEAFVEGASAPDPGFGPEEIGIQYADFAVWQRRWLAGEALEEQLAYWKQRLAGVPEALDLPLDHPRPAIETFRGSTRSLRIPAPVVRGLKVLGRRWGTTPSMTVLAAFKTLLCRYSGQTDIVVGTAVANRTRTELEGLIGFFVNTLVLRTDLAGRPSFVELLGRVR